MWLYPVCYPLKLKMKLIGLVLILFSFNCFASDIVTVYFYPFGIDPYAGISRKTIIWQATEKWTISSKSQISLLTTILNHGDEKEKFDDSIVKVMVISGDEIYFMDREGVVSKTGKADLTINKDMFMKFRKLLRPGQITVNPERKRRE